MSSTLGYKNMKTILLFICLIMLVGCYNPDPPLLQTDLPNKYSFYSNGGIFGYIVRPNGQRMSNHFGILVNGEEQWCNGFGWASDYVVCELEVVNSSATNGYIYKYFIMNTANESNWVVSTLEEAKRKWSTFHVGNFPHLQKIYKNTKER